MRSFGLLFAHGARGRNQGRLGGEVSVNMSQVAGGVDDVTDKLFKGFRFWSGESG